MERHPASALSERFIERRVSIHWHFFGADDLRVHLYRVSETGWRTYLGSVDYGWPSVGLAGDGQSIAYRHERRMAQLFGPGSRLRPSGIYVCGPAGPPRRIIPERDLKQGFAKAFDAPDNVVCFQYDETIDPEQLWMAAQPDGTVVPLVLVGANALHEAAYYGEPCGRSGADFEPQMIDELSDWRFSPLEMAVIWNRAELVRELLQAGADVAAGRSGAFIQALRFARVDMLDLLWRHAEAGRGADVDMRDPSTGVPALLVAIDPAMGVSDNPDGTRPDGGGYGDFWGRHNAYDPYPDERVETIRWLLEQGADPNATHGGYAHALFDAVLSRVVALRPEVARMLLEHGADVFWENERGETARERNGKRMDTCREVIEELESRAAGQSGAEREETLRSLAAFRLELEKREELEALLLRYESLAAG